MNQSTCQTQRKKCGIHSSFVNRYQGWPKTSLIPEMACQILPVTHDDASASASPTLKCPSQHPSPLCISSSSLSPFSFSIQSMKEEHSIWTEMDAPISSLLPEMSTSVGLIDKLALTGANSLGLIRSKEIEDR